MKNLKDDIQTKDNRDNDKAKKDIDRKQKLENEISDIEDNKFIELEESPLLREYVQAFQLPARMVEDLSGSNLRAACFLESSHSSIPGLYDLELLVHTLDLC